MLSEDQKYVCVKMPKIVLKKIYQNTAFDHLPTSSMSVRHLFICMRQSTEFEPLNSVKDSLQIHYKPYHNDHKGNFMPFSLQI